MNKKIISLALISIMILISLSTVLAAPYDLIHKTDISKNHSFTEFVDSPTVFDEVGADVENYLIEAEDGKLYNVEEVSAKVNEGKSFNEAVAELEPIEKPEEPNGDASIILSASPTERTIVPDGTTGPIEITAELKGFPEDVEATLKFSATWGQISAEETTTKHKVVVKLYPEDTIKDQTVNVRAEVIKAKNVKTGEEKDEYKNVEIAKIEVKFLISGGTSQGTLFQVNTAVANQADRITILFNEDLSDDAVSQLTARPGAFTVVDNLDLPVNKDGIDTNDITIPVSDVISTGDKSLLLILDRDGANFPLTDNVKHKVKVDLENSNPFLKVIGEAEFFLEDSSYVKLMKINTRTTKETLDYNQIEVQFSEAINDIVDDKEDINAFENSVCNLQNWVIDGLNLATQLPSNPVKTVLRTNPNVVIETVSIDKASEAREAVIITFRQKEDFEEFLSEGTHKLQVNTIGDWASVTDAVNIVATQELQYPGTALPDISVDWYMDGQPELIDNDYVLADGKDESPEQFIVKFNLPVIDTTSANGWADNFEIIVPDKSKTDPYDNFKWKLVSDTSAGLTGFTVTQMNVSGTKYLIELNNDWTKIYNTAVTKDNYHDSAYNPIRLVVKNFQDMYGRDIETVKGTGEMIADRDLNLVEDTQSPYTLLKEQIFDRGEIPGTVRIEMNEPCQFKDKFSAIISNTAAPLTPSQQQEEIIGGVDVNTFEYVFEKDASGNTPAAAKTIEGKIAAVIATKDGKYEGTRDYAVKVVPNGVLDAGTWKLVIRAISDDVGNAMATETMLVEIDPSIAAPAGLKCIGIDAHHKVVNDNNPKFLGRTWLPEYDDDIEGVNDAADIIHVLFNKDLKLTGDNSALNKANWRLNGEPLPVDGTRIQRGILGEPALQTAKNGVTIVLPDGYLQDRDDNHTLTMINIYPEKQVDDGDYVNIRLQIPYEDLHAIGAGSGVVINMINALPAVGDLTLANEAEVVAARAAYDALNSAERAEISAADLAKLMDAEAKIAELKGGEPEIKATIVVKTPGVLPGMDLVEVTLTGVDNPEDYEIKFEGKVFKFENGVFTYVVKTGTTAEQLEITKKSAPEEPEKPEVTIVVKTPGVLPGMDLVEVTLTGVDNPEDYEVKFEGKTFKFENGVFTYVVKTGTTADKLEIAKK